MSQSNDEKRDFSKFDDMTTEMLEDILRQDFNLTESDETNMDAILYIMEVIANRKKDGIPSIESSWASFKENYKPNENQVKNADEALLMDMTESNQKSRPDKAYIKRPGILRRAVSVAAVVAITFTLIIGAQAFGIDILGVLAKWTDETFSFQLAGSSPQSEPESLVAATGELQSLLAENNFSTDLAPTWIPEGYEMLSPKVVSNSFGLMILYSFSNNEGQLFSIQYDRFTDPSSLESTVYEKDSNDVVVHSNGKQEFYILSNINDYTATWSDGTICISIAGCESIDDLTKIIDSLGGN